MAHTRRFQQLDLRINELRSAFLPVEFDPTGLYDSSVYDRATAFRLMAHAEFESYIEDVVVAVVERAVADWTSNHSTSMPIVCILSSYEGTDRINAFKDNSLRKRPITLNTLIHKAHVHFKHNVSNNNGIRTSNILSLLVQIGIDDAGLSAQWIGSIDAFGLHRNVVGHRSGSVAYQADPKTALDHATFVKDGFRELDDKLVLEYGID